MKRSRRPKQAIYSVDNHQLTRVQWLQSLSWRRLGLWMVFLPLSGAIAIFSKPITNSDTLTQISQNISTNTETLLPYWKGFSENVQDIWEASQTVDPIQTELVEEIEPTSPDSSSSLSDAELKEEISNLSLEEIDRELQRLSSPLNLSKPGNSKKDKKNKSQEDNPLSIPHPLLSSDPYNLQEKLGKEPDSPYLIYPSLSNTAEAATDKGVTDSINPSFSTDRSTLPSTQPTPNSSAVSPLQTALEEQESSTTVGERETQDIQPTFGSSRLYPFSANPSITPTPAATSIRPRGYGLVSEPTGRSLYPSPYTPPQLSPSPNSYTITP